MTEVLINNRCSLERIDTRFMPLVEAARDKMVACCGDSLRELRLQGSVARGDARPGAADLDMIALLNGPAREPVHRCLEELATRLGAQTERVSRFDLEAIDRSQLEPFRRFVLSSDSLCIYGLDSLTLPEQSMERAALARLVTPDPATMLLDYLDWVEELTTGSDAERQFAGRIIGKDVLKVLRGVVLLRGARYEVAIPEIAAEIPVFAPEATDIAEQLLVLYREPTTDVEVMRQVAKSAAAFLKTCPEVALLGGQGDRDPDPLNEVIS